MQNRLFLYPVPKKYCLDLFVKGKKLSVTFTHKNWIRQRWFDEIWKTALRESWRYIFSLAGIKADLQLQQSGAIRRVLLSDWFKYCSICSEQRKSEKINLFCWSSFTGRSKKFENYQLLWQSLWMKKSFLSKRTEISNVNQP